MGALATVSLLFFTKRQDFRFDPGERGGESLLPVDRADLCLDAGRIAEAGQKLIRSHSSEHLSTEFAVIFKNPTAGEEIQDGISDPGEFLLAPQRL